MEPIRDVVFERDMHDNLRLTFKYPDRVPGFKYALVTIVEKDLKADEWTIRERTIHAAGTPPNVLTTKAYDFFNESAGVWADSPGNTAGDTDDVGRRHYLINLQKHTASDGVTVNLEFIYGDQVDLDLPDGFEFYALIAIVARAADHAVAVLGDMVITRVVEQVGLGV